MDNLIYNNQFNLNNNEYQSIINLSLDIRNINSKILKEIMEELINNLYNDIQLALSNIENTDCINIKIICSTNEIIND